MGLLSMITLRRTGDADGKIMIIRRRRGDVLYSNGDAADTCWPSLCMEGHASLCTVISGGGKLIKEAIFLFNMT